MMATGKPTIGILGGMGPEATVDLMRRVITATPAVDDCDHVHLLVDCNPDVPSRIAALIDGSGQSPAPELVRMAQRLETAGADALAIACNTAHGYACEVTAAVSIPLLDVIVSTRDAVAVMNLPRRRVGLLASTAVINIGLFSKSFATTGIQLVTPTAQSELMAVIKAVKRGNSRRNTRNLFRRIASELANDRVDILLIACSELSMLVDSLDDATPCLDTLDLLAREIVEFGLGCSRRESPEAALEMSR